jgi:hypothetical protein
MTQKLVTPASYSASYNSIEKGSSEVKLVIRLTFRRSPAPVSVGTLDNVIEIFNDYS